jgi:hypothetical protein
MFLNETYSRVQVGKRLSDMFPVKNGLKKGYFIAISFHLCMDLQEVGWGHGLD